MKTLIVLLIVCTIKPFGIVFANDYTGYVLEILSGMMPTLRNKFALVSRIYNHGSINGTARWTRDTDGTIEDKTEGTIMGAIADSASEYVDLKPETHKVSRFYLEDGELSISSVKDIARQKLPRRLKQLVNTIEESVAGLQSSVTTNRIGTLGAGFTRQLAVDAIELLELQDAEAETLVLHPSSKKQIKMNDDIIKLFDYTGQVAGTSFVPNLFEFGLTGRCNKIYSPAAGQFINLAFQREWAGIAFGNLSKVPAGAGRFVASLYDPISKITFRVIQKVRADGLGQEFIIDVQYDVAVQEEQLCVAILT